MADGIASAMVTTWLNSLTGTPASSFAQLHTGSPGAAGTSNVSSTTTREGVTWNAPSAGAVTNATNPAWPAWAGTSGEVVTDLSFWTASSAGTFDWSVVLTSSVTMLTGDTLTITSISVTVTPVAS
jgi:hypothetical protein